MDLSAVRKKAEGLGIDVNTIRKARKVDLVRAIQSKEGNTPCFATRSEGCPYVLCCFMTDCYEEARKMAAPKAAAGAKNKGWK